MKISDKSFAKKHWKTICFNYSKSKFFKQFGAYFEKVYLDLDEGYLSKVNYEFITLICKILDIKTKITWSSEYPKSEDSLDKIERLLDICRQANASEYISGPAAKDYLEEDLFNKQGVQVSWMDYSGYKTYNQLYGDFDHQLSILDLLFNTGDAAKDYMKTFNLPHAKS